MLSANYPWMVQHKFTQLNQEFAAKARTTPNKPQLDTEFQNFLLTNYTETAQGYLAELGKRLGWVLPIRASKGLSLNSPTRVEAQAVPRKDFKIAKVNTQSMSATENISQAYNRVLTKTRDRTKTRTPINTRGRTPSPTVTTTEIPKPIRLQSRLLPALTKPPSVRATPTNSVTTPPPVTPRLVRAPRTESPQELQEKARSFNQKVRRCFVPRVDSGKALDLQLKTVVTSDFTRIRDIPKYKLFRVR